MGRRVGVLAVLGAVLWFLSGCHTQAERVAPPAPVVEAPAVESTAPAAAIAPAAESTAPVAVISPAPSARAKAASSTAPAGRSPQMDVTLWTGETIRGPIDWRDSATVVVGAKELAASDIKVIQAVADTTATVKGVDLAKLPEPMRPLSAAALTEYRKRAAEASEKYKGIDNILCLDLGENMLRPDGTQVYTYHALSLILKDSGRSVANVTVGSSVGRSRARILYARSISPDGTSRWSDDTTFTESVPPQADQFVDTRGRILSGQVPGAEVDMLVEYAYEMEYYNPEVKDFFFPGYIFQSDKPVLDSVVDILVPEGRPLNYVTFRMPADAKEPVRSKRNGYDVYRWEMKDAPVITTEPAMPDMSDVVARLDCSLFFVWKDFMATTGRFQEERLKVTPEVQELADKLTAGKTTDDEKVAAIYHWVQRNINYLSIKASLSSGWAGHPAAETLKSGYGDCTDVSNLAATLCRAVGIEAYPADIKTNDAGRATTEIPEPDQNHAIVLVYPNGKPRFIDPTSQDYRYPYFRADDHGVKAIINIKQEIMDIPVPPPQDNMRESRQEMTLAADGSAKVIEKNAYTGSYEAGVRGFWRSVPPEMRAKLMQQSLQGRSAGAVIDSFDLGELENLDKQLRMELDYSIPRWATLMNDLYIFTLPNFKQQFPETALEKRNYDIEMPSTMEFDTTVNIALPEGYAAAGLPEPLVLHGKHLWFEGSVEKTEDGKGLVAKEIFKRTTRVVPAEDYDQFRKDASAIASWTDLKLVLQKQNAPANGEVK